MEYIWDAALHIPWWIYLLLIYLIVIGMQASKTRVVSLRRLFILPIILVIISINTLFTSFNFSAFALSYWGSSVLVGITLGWCWIYYYKIKVDKKNMLVQIPGTWSTLVIILVIFSAKYYFGYELTLDPHRIENTHSEISLLILAGIITGLFIGKLIHYLYYLKYGPHTHLRL